MFRNTLGGYPKIVAGHKSKAPWNDVLQRHIEKALREAEG